MKIITHPGSGIASPADWKGRRLAFASPTSNSDFKVPSVLLRSEFGLEADKDYTAVFAGSLPWAGSDLAKEFAVLGVSKFMPMNYRNDWAVVRKVDEALNVRYACQ